MSAIAGKLGAIFQEYTNTDKSFLVDDFQVVANWSLGAPDYTEKRLGSKSLKLTETNNVSSWIESYRTIAMDLTKFSSGANSTDNDYIHMTCYIENATKVSSICFGFSSEGVYDSLASYEVFITSGLTSGWNYFKVKKSAFINADMDDWSEIGSVKVGWLSQNNSQDISVMFQSITLVHKDFDIMLTDGSLYTMSQKVLCSSWSLDMSNSLGDISSLGKEWKENLPTLSEYKVSIEKFWDTNIEIDSLGEVLAISLYTSLAEGYRYDASGKISSGSINTPNDGVVGESLEFSGSGEIYYVNQNIVEV